MVVGGAQCSRVVVLMDRRWCSAMRNNRPLVGIPRMPDASVTIDAAMRIPRGSGTWRCGADWIDVRATVLRAKHHLIYGVIAISERGDLTRLTSM